MNSKAFSSVLKYLPNLVATILLILVEIYFVPRIGNTTMYSSNWAVHVGIYHWHVAIWSISLIRFFVFITDGQLDGNSKFCGDTFLLAYGIPSSFNLFHNQLFLQQYLKFAPGFE